MTSLLRSCIFLFFAIHGLEAWGAGEILEESFPAAKYGTEEESLHGMGGAEGGFAASWKEMHGGEGRVNEVALYVPTGLEYTDAEGNALKSEGGAAQFLMGAGGPGTMAAGRPLECSPGSALAAFSNGGQSINQGTLYISYLMFADVRNGPYQMTFSLDPADDGWINDLRVGFINSQIFEIRRVKENQYEEFVQQPVSGDFPMLVVLRVRFPKGGEQGPEIAFWLNPSLGKEREPDGVLVLNDKEFSINSLGLCHVTQAVGIDARLVVDEIRMGPTFASVTPKK